MALPDRDIIFLALSIFLFLKIDRLRFLIVLVAADAYFLLWQFPEVPNHVNWMIFVNVALIVGIGVSYLRPDGAGSDAQFYRMIRPILRLMIIVTFSVAGFHKLNYDFLNPGVSCVDYFGREIYSMLKADFLGLGVRVAVVLGVIGFVVLGFLWTERRNFAVPKVDWAAVGAPLISIGAACVLLLVLVERPPQSPAQAMVFVVAVIVLCWQLVEAPLLLIPRFQWVALCLSLFVHAQLAMVGIVDFQSVAVALLLTFIPDGVWRDWRRHAHLRLGPIIVNRAHAYFLLNMFGGALMLLHHRLQWVFIPGHYIVTGLLFNISVLVMLWPIFVGVLDKNCGWRWRGVKVFQRKTPAVLYIAPAALLLFGMTSHFGLRTTGNFSMFSNLGTEGERSNHLLFGSNPLKSLATRRMWCASSTLTTRKRRLAINTVR